jgi:hypothetical protein
MLMRIRILACLLALVLLPVCWAQTYVLFNSPHQQFLDTSGRPLAGGRIYTYIAGTTTPQVTYQDSTGTTPNTNPIVLDSGGFGTIYLSTTLSYKVVMKNAQNVQQWSVDNIAGTTGTLSTVPLNSILPATGASTIDNGTNQQAWRWQLTGSTPGPAMAFTENTASTNTGANSSLLNAQTLAGSTIWPFRSANAGNGFGVTPTGNVQTFGTGTFIGPLTGNVTGNITGVVTGTAGSSLIGNVTGNVTGTATNVTGIVAVANGGTGTATPSLIAGTNIAITGAWPNQTVATTPAATFSGAVSAASLKASNLTPSASTCLQADATGTVQLASGPCGIAGQGTPPLSNIVSATATNTISNGSFPQIWNWNLGATGNTAMTIGEGTAATGNSTLLKLSALSATTTALDVINPALASQIHFGTSTYGNGGGYLSTSPTQAANLSASGHYTGTAWIADSTSASLLIANPTSSPGGFYFYAGTGLTAGNTIPWTTVATLNSAGVFAPASISAAGNVTAGSLNVTTNSTVTGTETAGRLAVTTGVGQNNGGIKHQRWAGCTTTSGANGSCSGTASWATAFADINYTMSCIPTQMSGGYILLLVVSKSVTGFNYILENPPTTTAAASAQLECIAMHD